MPYKDKEQGRIANKAASRRHYERNMPAMKQRAVEYTRAHRNRMRAYIWEYLSSHACIDCGESDPIVLEFDHRDQATKVAEISNLISKAVGMGRLVAEIEKCDVRCANCHRRRTARQLGWYLGFQPPESDAT